MSEHEPTFVRYDRGRSVPFNRPVYGWWVRCSCGDFTRRVNGRKAEARRAFRGHLKSEPGPADTQVSERSER